MNCIFNNNEIIIKNSMKLELSNFKCHAHKEIEIGGDGVILISGKSGIGKTSIIEALIFVLFGSGRKIIRFGHKSCYVRMNVDLGGQHLNIYRTKGPNRLTITTTPIENTLDDTCSQLQVDKTNANYYEDDAAQAIIHEYYGSEYQSIGYLSQSSFNSFVLMSPQDKLSFLEQLIFKSTDLKNIKSGIQQLIRERTQLLQTTTGKIEMLSQIIHESSCSAEDGGPGLSIGKVPAFPITKESGFITNIDEQNIVTKNKHTEKRNNLTKQQTIKKKLHKLSLMRTEREKFDHANSDAENRSAVFSDRFLTLKMSHFQKFAIENGVGEQPQDTMNTDLCIIKQIRDECSDKYKDICRRLLSVNQNKEYIRMKTDYETKQVEYNIMFAKEKTELDNQYNECVKKSISVGEIAECYSELSYIDTYILDLAKYNDLMSEYDTTIDAYIQLKCTDIDKSDYQVMVKNTNTECKKDELKAKIKEYETDISELLKLYEKTKLAEKKYKCPSCKTNISFCTKTNTLIAHDIVTDSKLSCEAINEKLDKKRKRLEKNKLCLSNFLRYISSIDIINDKLLGLIAQYDDADSPSEPFKKQEIDLLSQKSDINKIINQNNQNTILQKKVSSKLKHESLDNHIITRLASTIQKLDKQINQYENTHTIDQTHISADDDELLKSSIDLEYECQQHNETYDQLSSYHVQYISATKILNELISNKNILSLRSIKKHIDTNSNELAALVTQFSLIESQILDIERWKLDHERYTQLQTRQLELIHLESTMTTVKNKLQSIYRLKDIIKQAESIKLTHAIESINQYVSNYLEIFFQTDPIHVTLSIRDASITGTGSGTGSQKTGQIVLNVDYKEMEADVSILSGGELQRVIIAYNIALSELFSVPMILLDECTSNLDQELTEAVVKGIKYNCSCKTIIMVAHQVVSGIFDKVILIES